jgi:hypothetical protein
MMSERIGRRGMNASFNVLRQGAQAILPRISVCYFALLHKSRLMQYVSTFRAVSSLKRPRALRLLCVQVNYSI